VPKRAKTHLYEHLKIRNFFREHIPDLREKRRGREPEGRKRKRWRRGRDRGMGGWEGSKKEMKGGMRRQEMFDPPNNF
jgi:hypothetical protein